ncbi:MAG: hypothetical protein ABR867_01120 [Nitrososphaerales archaeon]|jgi:hypothetical protein
MIQVSVLVERVDAARLSDKASENAPSNYSLNVSMSERDRGPETLTLRFTLELTDQPQLARLALSGTATLIGTKDDIQSAIASPDDKVPPLVLTTIYERTYGLLYLVAGSLKIPRPLPTLLKSSSAAKK